MPFLADKSCPLPTQDICSWIFDEPKYDIDQPIFLEATNPSNHITAKQARSLVRKLCAGFRKAGLKPGDCVTIHAFNSIYYPIIVLGIIAFGGIFAGTNPAYTPFELKHHLKTARAKFLVAEPEILDSLRKAAKEVDIPDSRIVLLDEGRQAGDAETISKHFRSWRTLMSHGEEDWVSFNDEKTQSTTEAARLFSSGTTGLPKAAMISHRNFVVQHTVCWEKTRPTRQIRRLVPLPFFHAAVAPLVHTGVLRSGEMCYIQRRFALEEFLAAIDKYQITDLILVPPMINAVLNAPALTRKYSLRSLENGFTGAAPLDKEQQKRFIGLLKPEARFTQVWGMTETCCVATSFDWHEQDETGSVGRAKQHMDMKIVDDEGNDVTGYDVTGEICVHGPGVILGYLGSEEGEVNRRDWDADGYFHTGDIGVRKSETGLWFLVDRKKELIKVRAFQVAPAELEGVLLGHPGIADAAVIGVKFERDGSEFPRAYIVRKPGSAGASLTERDVQQFVASRLAGYKRLEGGVVFTDAIPKNASGKILKRLLREIAAKEIGPKL
ncbi:acetyl-CoA synthetase-like protein [Viridothelium virens]|uniref:Acetyl-CoA synthetase-like protein n=1 Tax=Viridothelium virens TaxID=1048519 RepID=A0A6A6H6M6_VIRVR|nr:acetyl-CoA synthetase-like protein [Viridothelium virens]